MLRKQQNEWDQIENMFSVFWIEASRLLINVPVFFFVMNQILFLLADVSICWCPSTMKVRRDADLQNKTLQNYNDIATLSAVKLKQLCVKFWLDISLPKKAKIVYLCHSLGISTSGINRCVNTARKRKVYEKLTRVQVKELEELTSKVLYSLPPSQWSCDIQNLPVIEDRSVKEYLLKTNVLDKAASQTYKLSRPYQLKQFVHSVRYFENA